MAQRDYYLLSVDIFKTILPVKRHRGEPGRTRDTHGTHTGRHGSHSRSSQPSEPERHTRTTTRRPKPRPTQQPQARSRPLPAADWYSTVPRYSSRRRFVAVSSPSNAHAYGNALLPRALLCEERRDDARRFGRSLPLFVVFIFTLLTRTASLLVSSPICNVLIPYEMVHSAAATRVPAATSPAEGPFRLATWSPPPLGQLGGLRSAGFLVLT